MTNRANSGFALSDMLVALGVIGLIAAYQIPKLLMATEIVIERTSMQLNIATIKSSVYNAYSAGNVRFPRQAELLAMTGAQRTAQATNLRNFLFAELGQNSLSTCPPGNTVTVCFTAQQYSQGTVDSLGLWSEPTFDFARPPLGEQTAAIQFKDGSQIIGLQVGDTWWNWQSQGTHFILDYNGTKGPNRLGNDQLYLVLCLTPDGCMYQGPNAARNIPVPFGEVATSSQISYGTAGNGQLFLTLFPDMARYENGRLPP